MTSDVAAPTHAPASTAVSCWHCGANGGAALFCPACGAVQPLPADIDYFSALGLPRAPALDREALARRYYELSRQLHPDRHQTSAPAAQAASAANTALINRAFRTLRDPVERGRYWLQLRGVGTNARPTTVPASLAALVFDVQEQLERLRRANDADRPARRNEVVASKQRIEQAETAALEQLERNLAQWSEAADEAALTTALARILADVAYLRTLRRDIDKELDA
jgi:molecular chaperone HscB